MHLAHLFLPVQAFRVCILNRKTGNRKNIEYFLTFPHIIFARYYIKYVILRKTKKTMDMLQYLFRKQKNEVFEEK